MTDIEKWKNTREFTSGVELAIKYNASKTLLSLLQSGANSFTERKLSEFLNEVNQRLIAAEEKTREHKKSNEKYNAKVDVNALPPVLQQKTELKAKLFIEAAHYHSQLDVVKTDAERKKLANRILSIQNEINGIWEVLDHYKATGEIKLAEGSLESLPLKDLLKKQSLFQNYFYKHRKSGNKQMQKKYENLIEQVNLLINERSV